MLGRDKRVTPTSAGFGKNIRLQNKNAGFDQILAFYRIRLLIPKKAVKRGFLG